MKLERETQILLLYMIRDTVHIYKAHEIGL